MKTSHAVLSRRTRGKDSFLASKTHSMEAQKIFQGAGGTQVDLAAKQLTTRALVTLTWDLCKQRKQRASSRNIINDTVIRN